jgi:hypothetical protein
LLETYTTQRNFEKIREVSHKMLNFLRQLEIHELEKIFSALENYETSNLTEQTLMKLTFEGINKMNLLLKSMRKNEGIQDL